MPHACSPRVVEGKEARTTTSGEPRECAPPRAASAGEKITGGEKTIFRTIEDNATSRATDVSGLSRQNAHTTMPVGSVDDEIGEVVKSGRGAEKLKYSDLHCWRLFSEEHPDKEVYLTSTNSDIRIFFIFIQ